MNMRILTHVNREEGSTWIFFRATDHWFHLPLPLELFEQENNCTVLSNQTTTFREVRLKKGDIEFELLHDDLFGNFISTNNPKDVPALLELAESVLKSMIRIEALDNA